MSHVNDRTRREGDLEIRRDEYERGCVGWEVERGKRLAFGHRRGLFRGSWYLVIELFRGQLF
jgi:hypothetical protein